MKAFDKLALGIMIMELVIIIFFMGLSFWVFLRYDKLWERHKVLQDSIATLQPDAPDSAYYIRVYSPEFVKLPLKDETPEGR